jgi:CheY-like chemotaxis protein
MEGLDPHDPRSQDLEQVVKAASRATTITRGLLGFSRHQVLERKHVDPNRIISDLTEMIRPLIGAQIRLDTALAEDAAVIHADPGELQQALLNLCLNARDAMAAGGNLLLKTENVVLDKNCSKCSPALPPGRYVVFTVTDTGCGMTPETQQRIFEPFYTTKEIGKGTGLGLATVYATVRQHDGAIHVASQQGRGTTFKIYLPAAGAQPDAECPRQREAPAGGVETILFAEDEPMVRSLAIRILQEAGYNVLPASNGEEALRLYDENQDRIDLVLLDAIMPKLSGHEVCRRIKAKNPKAKVLFCSGYNVETVLCDGQKTEDLRLIAKPFDTATLLQGVREAIEVG